MTKKATTALLTFVLLILGLATGAAAQPQGTSNILLLPSFDVDLSGYGKTTFLSLVNSSDQRAELDMTVYSNWGIEIFSTRASFRAHEARIFNLADWLVQGTLPDRTLAADELAHAQAALTGLASPKTGKYYGTEEELQIATGSIDIRRRSGPGELFGDFFVLDPAGDNAEGDLLVDESPGDCADGSACARHGLRFFTGGALAMDTEMVIRAKRKGQPSDSPFLQEQRKIEAQVSVYRQDGTLLETREMSFLPLEAVKISELGFDAKAGWIDVTTEEETFIAVRYSADGRFSVGLRAVCLSVLLPPPGTPPGLGKIHVEKSTNGQDADAAPGPEIKVGDPVEWTYKVTNIGNVALTEVAVSDDQGVAVSCPQDALAPGESMTCTGSGSAILGQYGNVGTATAKTPDGKDVEDSDPSHYLGKQEIPLLPSISLEKSTNGQDADAAPGPSIQVGAAVNWTYAVQNDGTADLYDIQVSDDKGVQVSCPKTTLAPQESMTCTGHGTATLGQYENLGTVTASANVNGNVVEGIRDEDPSHYFGTTAPVVSIDIEKSTNGQDADAAPGPEIAAGDPVQWTYRVTNTGNVALLNVSVSDDQGVAVSCPKTSLAAQESMTCTGHGTAVEGQYENLGTATGDYNGQKATDSDPSHYYGTSEPPPNVSIDIEKWTNGVDADDAPGPEIQVGDSVEWTYRVTNTGEVELSQIAVSDDQGVAVSCPKDVLAPQESMDCKGYGTAVAGQYKNVGTATGDYDGQETSDSDPSHYFGKEDETKPADKRMTGGGSVFTDGVRYTHGFELHCDTSKPNNLEINWGPGHSNRFHLTNLASGECSDDPSISEGQPVAGFDTFVGTGTGRLNGEDGATISFLFTDAGEPGKDADWAQFTIVPAGGGEPIVVSGYIMSGNQQAHGN